MYDLTRDDVAALLSYCPESGSFTWRVDLRGGVKAGDVAGCIERYGYRVITIRKRSYFAHRLAFLLMTGAWPTQFVDHINGVKDDNRWSNLRDVSSSVNSQNRRKATDGNTTGLLGVHKYKGQFKAMIDVPGTGKKIFLGLYDSPEVAHRMYLAAKRQLHPGCTL